MDVSERPDLFVFRLGRERFALPLARVLAAVRAAYAEALPGAPETVLGLLNLRGQALPVIDLGLRFGRPAKAISPQDIFLISRSARRTMALRIDAVDGLYRAGSYGLDEAGNVPAVSGLAGVAVLADGLTLIFDLDACLSLESEAALDAALAKRDAPDA
jgi:purine-binding chemotaxis protein CheW